MANFAEYAIESAGVPPAQTNADAFGYNDRSEVVFSHGATENTEYSYDGIGNLLSHSNNAATNTYTANSLNQYTSILCASAPPCEYSHTPDGGIASDGTWLYAYDAEDRLLSVTSATLTNGALRIVNSYDYRNRRIGKTTERYGNGSWLAEERRTFVYDGWNLIHETIEAFGGGATNITEKQYFWGLDLSNALQGAGGVGGLLAVSIGGQFYFPAYDANGNITKYLDESGATVASYEYDAFGRLIFASGLMADSFAHRFSTKYFDSETGLYYYGYRYYKPPIMRWLNCDPIEEEGGLNLYAMCRNHPLWAVDTNGQYEWTEESARDKLHEAIREFRQYGWDFAADALAHFVDGTGNNVNLSQYSGDISGNSGWRQRFLDNVSSKLAIGEKNKKIGDVEHEANFHNDLSNEDFNSQKLFSQQFAYRFQRYNSGNLFYALFGSRYSYVGNASKTKEKIDGNCCIKLDLDLLLASWDALTYPRGFWRNLAEQYSAATYLEELRKTQSGEDYFMPYLYLLWNESGQWVQCAEKYRGGTSTKSWRRR